MMAAIALASYITIEKLQASCRFHCQHDENLNFIVTPWTAAQILSTDGVRVRLSQKQQQNHTIIVVIIFVIAANNIKSRGRKLHFIFECSAQFGAPYGVLKKEINEKRMRNLHEHRNVYKYEYDSNTVFLE